jgi:hypothetical protein
MMSYITALKLLFKGLLKGELKTFDFIVKIIHGFTAIQRRYNFYAVKVRKQYLDLKGTNVAIYVLLGKYYYLWDVVLERLYYYNEGFDVVLVNPGGFHSDAALALSKNYGFSYIEFLPNNIEAAQNYVIQHIIDSPIVIKLDDDVFLTKFTIKNMIRVYSRLKEEGVDIGFVAPVLNVNNVSFYHFLKTLDLIEEYSKIFEKPIFAKHWTKQRIWYDPEVAKWIWERSIPLNKVAYIFAKKNNELYEYIPVRFSISCILFERAFLLRHYGYSSPGPRVSINIQGKIRNTPLIWGSVIQVDEDSINFYVDNKKHARILALDSFAGHLSYYPQQEVMLRWYRNNKHRLLEDLKE